MQYILADDLMNGFVENVREELSQVNMIFEDGQIIEIMVPFSEIFNRRYYSRTMEFETGWIGIKDFMSLF